MCCISPMRAALGGAVPRRSRGRRRPLRGRAANGPRVRTCAVARSIFLGGRFRSVRAMHCARARRRSSAVRRGSNVRRRPSSIRCTRNEMARRNRNGILIDFSSFVAREAFPLTRSTDAEPACVGRADRREPSCEAEFAEGVSPGRCRAAWRLSRFFLVSGSVP
ncbi:hypothetical protein D8O27_11600 [Burkholderia mallei]|uniref:Uncharacterized protein n=2 Tax=Burkholderia mallei TaxID=13373 RepID=A0AAX1XA90_BURML|nr:hypothetical protein BMAA0151 [Burkholderia mallei ATCC 23344]MBK3335930.1 hypothetical protein [Burkholderia pseudomallei]RKN98645.1 hypothetical protein D8O31_11980 [Burkholderia mallei]NRE29352.1 hypothetical protein [Burkholderia pseudomallei]RKO02777.1 hypothetical protein D8O03_11810 [Burkholderia mallei]